ncbi:MAG: hypothetical protein AAB354_09065, partial [candidate division KSB1 bacterium]
QAPPSGKVSPLVRAAASCVEMSYVSKVQPRPNRGFFISIVSLAPAGPEHFDETQSHGPAVAECDDLIS